MATLQSLLRSTAVVRAIAIAISFTAPLAVFSTSGFAQSPKRARSVLTYVPPNRGTPTRGIRGAGSRGCSIPPSAAKYNASKLVQLTLLVPSDHVGQTVSSHPSFYWHVSAVPSVPMEFSLVQPGVAMPLLVKQVTVTKPGVVELTLPPNHPGLKVGSRYRWSVALVCNSDRRSNDVFAQSWIERVATTPEGVTQASNATPAQQAELYAKAGLWYDALKSVAVADTANPPLIALNDDFQALLEQSGLADANGQVK
ncbi:MAG: DUF928 domain-containing protein [Cyanobacteria bacterium]|nr:DUF928 domain-containing protein [Cyanobacteriota bacterium]MDW8200166.1 DUF928 domain-containing protein [Cyanobacteriota bacterium SKYGB_h_bin112]